MKNKQNKQLFAAEENDWDPIKDLKILAWKKAGFGVLISLLIILGAILAFLAIGETIYIFPLILLSGPVFCVWRALRDISDEITTIKSIIRD